MDVMEFLLWLDEASIDDLDLFALRRPFPPAHWWRSSSPSDVAKALGVHIQRPSRASSSFIDDLSWTDRVLS
jgi:hypothetical protein